MSLLRAVFLAVGLLATLPLQAETVTDIVEVTRPAEELLQVLQPLLGDDVSASAYRQQLILRGPAGRVTELRALLQQLDRPLRNLRISVRRAVRNDASRQGAGIRIDDEQAVFGIHNDSRSGNEGETRSITLLEGEAAFLALDSEVPVLALARGNVVGASLLPLGDGLELRPQPSGDQVRLEIRQRSARHSNAAPTQGGVPAVATSTVQSVVLLTPGVWTAIAGIDTQASSSRSGIGYGERRQRSSRNGWEVKVELLPP